MEEQLHLLFSYGTLQLEKVQLENYGRILKGVKDRLNGYKIENIRINDLNVIAKSQLDYHPIAFKSQNGKDFIEGVIFELTNTELIETDKYETNDYQRILEIFDSGKKAWVYVSKNI